MKEGEFERQHYLALFLQKSTKPIVFVIFQGVVKVTFLIFQKLFTVIIPPLDDAQNFFKSRCYRVSTYEFVHQDIENLLGQFFLIPRSQP